MKLSAYFLPLSALIVLAILCPSRARCEQIVHNNDHHAPQTQAEKALDSLIRRSQNDENMFEFMLGRPWYDPSKDQGYARLFTPALLKAWTEKEAELVQKSCGGKYIDGEICGIDYSPITWGQDYTEDNFYRTFDSSQNAARISATSNQFAKSGAIYTLTKYQDGWRLNSVDCKTRFAN
jgi:hypothetical protein